MNFIAPGTHRTERALQKEKTLPEGTTRGPRTVAGRVRTLVRHYSWMRGRPSAKNFIPFNPISEFPITQKNLRIWFDKTGVVKRHEFTGVFYIYRAPLVGTDAPHSFRPLTPAELDHFSE